jgi:hypothetical protein
MTRFHAWMAAVMALASTSAAAYDSYQAGRITNLTVAGNTILIMLDTGMPDNCAGTPSGWLQIPEASKVMQALALGIWMRGDAAQTNVTVYTDARTGGGYCQINQIDPAN